MLEAVDLLKTYFAESVRGPSWRWSLRRERWAALPGETGTDSTLDCHLRLLSLFGDVLLQSMELVTGRQCGKVACPGCLPYVSWPFSSASRPKSAVGRGKWPEVNLASEDERKNCSIHVAL